MYDYILSECTAFIFELLVPLWNFVNNLFNNYFHMKMILSYKIFKLATLPTFMKLMLDDCINGNGEVVEAKP